MDKKEIIADKKAQLIAMTDAFATKYLDEDYRQLSQKLIEAMGRKRDVPFSRGELKNWAAGVIHALGMVNFLFDSSSKPYVASPDIATHFGVAASTMGQKSKIIRDMFKMSQLGSPDWQTSRMRERFMPLEKMIAETFLEPSMGSLFEEILGNSEPEEGEFVDDSHELMAEFYGIMQSFDMTQPNAKKLARMEKMIQEDPDYFEPYIVLSGVMVQQGRSKEADALLETGYQRAIAVITRENGQWPEILSEDWIENQHIIQILVSRAMTNWIAGKTEEALDLLRKLLHANPDEEIGIGPYILAIRSGLDFDEFQAKFGPASGDDGTKLMRWFDKNSLRFPDEFDWWRDAVGNN